MANSISLSSDMKTLYLIDSKGYSTSFPLTGDGAYVTSIVGDVYVVDASTPLTGGTDECMITGTAQWQGNFHIVKVELQMIGSDDTDSTLTMKPFDLTKGNTVNLRLNDVQTKILIRI